METVSTTYEERGITLKQHLLRKAGQKLDQDGVLPVDLINKLMQEGVDVNAFEKAWKRDQGSGQGRFLHMFYCTGTCDYSGECDCE